MKHSRIVLVALFSCLASCAGTRTVGDAKLSGAGFWVLIGRYHLDAGEIDFGRAGEKTFVLRNLPSAEFTLGFAVTSAVSEPGTVYDTLRGTKPITAEVALDVTNENGQRVISVVGPLREWTWSGALGEASRAFVYRRGKTWEEPMRNGGVEIHNIDVGADGGWGSYFFPRRGGVYTVRVRILSIGPSASCCAVRLVATGQ